MQNSVEDLLADSAADVAQSTITIYGRPVQTDADGLAERFKNSDLPDYLAFELRHAVGNYVLVSQAHGEIVIVTSPGYCGGYVYEADGRIIIATLLSTLLARQPNPVAMDSFGLCYFLNYAPKSSFNQLPFSTMFGNVRRLPPAAVIKIRDGAVTTCCSYLTLAHKLDLPDSFEMAIGEVADAFAGYYRRVKESPALLFSGGVDSLAIYLALRAKMRPDAIRLFTMDVTYNNGLGRAIPVAAKLGYEFELLSSENLHTPAARLAFRQMMSKDLVTTRGPHIGFIEDPIPETDILHGQNMDAIVDVNMTVLTQNLDKPFLSKAKIDEAVSPDEKVIQYSSFIGNLQFTDAYLQDPLFQKETVNFFAMLHPNTVPDPDPGGRGILRGMLSSQYPNLLPLLKTPFDPLSILNRDLDLFESFTGVDMAQPGLGIDLARFYTYAHLANKRVSGVGLPSGSRTLFAAQSGPIISYFVGRKRGLSDAAHPKREVYEYAQKMTGVPYRDLLTGQSNAFRRLRAEEPAEDSFLLENMDYLQPDTARVLPAIQDAATRAHVDAVYAETRSAARPGAAVMSNYTRSRGRQLLNLELILHRAEREKADQA